MSAQPCRFIALNSALEVLVYQTSKDASASAAARIASLIRSKPSATLGLATGSTPIAVYQELVRMHRLEGLSFSNITSYNLDEYYPISPLNDQSYRWFMHQNLFQHIDIPANQAHVLDGTVPAHAASEHADQFDRWIEQAGGLDLQLLGIGRNGHVGFNEPFEASLIDACDLPTRLIELHPVTIADAAPAFHGSQNVPTHALTVGTRQILKARQILILAFGKNKADAVAASLQGLAESEVPASLLQTVADRVVWFLDEDSAAGLKV
ncbi:MAG: glucosamine-6-phosphate deaminase [Planctomycetota bacterium]|nr:MAG: glucosamine-6-phosphate deaminase [Planctomycetota bacterium]